MSSLWDLVAIVWTQAHLVALGRSGKPTAVYGLISHWLFDEGGDWYWQGWHRP